MKPSQSSNEKFYSVNIGQIPPELLVMPTRTFQGVRNFYRAFGRQPHCTEKHVSATRPLTSSKVALTVHSLPRDRLVESGDFIIKCKRHK